MEIFRVSFIGHRELHNVREIEDKLEKSIYNLIDNHQYVEFYLGRNGDFDISAASSIKRVQRKSQTANSSLILVLPYHAKDEEFYKNFYDEIILPIEKNTHFKAAITKRNEWMIDNSDLLIVYVKDQSGGAYTALKYAKKKEVEIINIAYL